MNNRYINKRTIALFAIVLFNSIDAQVASDWDLSNILSVMNKSWSIGNGCMESNHKTINIQEGLELNGHTLEIMDARLQVFGELTNFGQSIGVFNELIIYSCDSSELVLYQETLSADNNTLTFDFKVYPNPASNVLNIVIDDLDLYSVYDMRGNLILKGINKTIEVNQLNSGVYFLCVQYNESRKIKRFIKK